MVRYGHGQWTSCGADPELAGYLTVSKYVPVDRRGTYWLFTCRAHRGLVTDPRPLTADDRADLEYRQEQVKLALAGQPYRRFRAV
jgi:hypothetical protein